ncbi:PilW family protein [Janthinobacterium sp. 17J80-10]|uniref:PilW family protein n=1 Tax=Janthinobacterium sp. 17J80-10 TaxID=2497863 RepID=UPI00100578CA|nr:PilW family protein [Janthinobacterium sp. 17J80-10]QAU35239.1 pilus assembly protein PilW [Janthinobacterium sp. 17J80-10]
MHHAGLTLVELMVSMSLSLLVVLAATLLLSSSKSSYITNDNAVVIQESGRHALEIIARALRQSGYQDWDGGGAVRLAAAAESASLTGIDARSLKSTGTAMDAPVKKSINGSDVLGIRFHGAGVGDQGDETMLNCAGFGVPSSLKDGADGERGWSIFFVAEDAAGEPELRCKYKGKSSWTAVAIARGVESFQILYGLDGDGDGVANAFMSASQIDTLDEALLLSGASSAEQAIDKNRKTHWKKIVAIKAALLIRDENPVRADVLAKTFDLFGKDYADAAGNADPGTRIDEKTLPAKSRNRMRKLFTATIQLRNQDMGNPS